MLMPERTTLAEAPMRVPFPPKHAPREIAHHRGSMSTPLSPRAITKGIKVATNGMLSSIDESRAEAHSKIIIIIIGCPSAVLRMI